MFLLLPSVAHRDTICDDTRTRHYCWNAHSGLRTAINIIKTFELPILFYAVSIAINSERLSIRKENLVVNTKHL